MIYMNQNGKLKDINRWSSITRITASLQQSIHECKDIIRATCWQVQNIPCWICFVFYLCDWFSDPLYALALSCMAFLKGKEILLEANGITYMTHMYMLHSCDGERTAREKQPEKINYSWLGRLRLKTIKRWHWMLLIRLTASQKHNLKQQREHPKYQITFQAITTISVATDQAPTTHRPLHLQ